MISISLHLRNHTYLALDALHLLLAIQLPVVFAHTGSADPCSGQCLVDLCLAGFLTGTPGNVLQPLLFVLCYPLLSFVARNLARIVVDI